MDKFLTPEEWESSDRIQDSDKIVKWEDIKQRVIYCIDYLEGIETKNSWETFILHFSDVAGVQQKTFCPGKLLKTIRKMREPDHRPYFVAYGVDRNNGGKFPNFEITFKRTNNKFDIFEKPVNM